MYVVSSVQGRTVSSRVPTTVSPITSRKLVGNLSLTILATTRSSFLFGCGHAANTTSVIIVSVSAAVMVATFGLPEVAS